MPRYTIFIPVTSNFFARNFLRTDAFSVLRNDREVSIVLLAPEAKVPYYRQRFGSKMITVEALPAVRERFSERLFSALEQASIVTNRTHMDQMTFLFRHSDDASRFQFSRRLPIFLLRRLLRLLGRIGRPWRTLVRTLYSILPGVPFAALFETYQPSLVFAPTMVFAEDFLLLREAKRRGIRTVGSVFSWDSLYSKTFLRVHPDHLILQTELMRQQATRLGDYPLEQTTVTGVVQYDGHFRRQEIFPRDVFFRQIGADPRKKLILYAFSGKASLKIDTEIVDILAAGLAERNLKDRVEVLLRPYPRFDWSPEKLQRFRVRHGFLAERSTTAIGTGVSQWEMDESAIVFLRNSLAHADVIVTIYSTFLVEGAIFDKPIIAVSFDGYQPHNYWNSARRFFDWDHLRDIKNLRGITITENATAFLDAIEEALAHPERLTEGRQRMVKTLCQFTDAGAGARVAETLLLNVPHRS